MKVIIFGATGTTGSEIVAQALEKGYDVTAFVRNPDKVGHTHANLRLYQGDVLNPHDVAKAVQGQDAVLCALGAGLKGTVRSQGTQNIIQAMENAGVQRLVVQSTLGVGDSRDNLNAYWKYLMFGLLLRRAYADHVRQETAVKQSPLAWTIVRPGALKNGPRSGNYRHGFPPTDQSITLEIAKVDVAEFMLKQLVDDTYLRATPGLSH
jgi:putative NADH-flavin reductase